MRKALPVFVASFACAVLIAQVCFADPLDLRDAPPRRIIILPEPPGEGEATAREVLLPEFTGACFFAGDAPDFRWIGASNRILPWIAGSDLSTLFSRDVPQNPTVEGPNRRTLLTVFQLANGEYLVLMPLAGPYSISWLEVRDDGALVLDFGSAGTAPPEKGPIPLVAWARSADVYEAFRGVWELIIEAEPLRGHVRWRQEKAYPTPFEYLGWCSWEQYHRNINEGILTGAMDDITKSVLPIRWMLVDDGHTIIRNNALVSVEPDPKKFPHGWGPVLDRRAEDGIRWVGNWHTLLGYWGNISAEHMMPELTPFLMPHPGPEKKGILVPRDEPEASRAFYEHFIGRIKKQGFDFIKVDNMSRSTIEYAKAPNAAYAQNLNLQSIEEVTHVLGVPLMNCSAQNTIGLLNTAYSATMRVSIDYRRGALDTSKSHIFQSFAVTLWLGQTLWPDHDMFHSSDREVAEAVAVTKAMSAGPVYVSDAPKDFATEFIRPLCYEDGRVLRPLAPGVPLPDSILLDAMNDPSRAYAVVAPLPNGAAAIAAFNLVHPTPEKAVPGRITLDDYRAASGMMQPYPGPWTPPDEGLAVYDWAAQQGKALPAEGLDYELEGFTHKLFLLCPITKGWAVMGRADKYLGPAAVDIEAIATDTVTLTLHEQGPLVIYSERPPTSPAAPPFTSIGNGFYTCALAVSEKECTLTITR